MHSRKFPGGTADVTAARRFTEEALQKWDAEAWEWTATLLVTELAANAVLHAKTAFWVTLSFDGDLLTVRVTDQSAQAVCPRAAGDLATTGRGLSLIDQLSACWGVECGSTSKTVWCSIASADDEATTDLDFLWTEDELNAESVNTPLADSSCLVASAAA
jgi:anti-sigma regulatory factor (Ser/Thr protein kinase)